MKFHFKRIFNSILVLGSIMLVSLNTLNALAYITEVKNNTDQIVSFMYPVPVDMEIEKVRTTPFGLYSNNQTCFKLYKRSSSVLTGAYLPSEDCTFEDFTSWQQFANGLSI
jgi:hypothetical protein